MSSVQVGTTATEKVALTFQTDDNTQKTIILSGEVVSGDIGALLSDATAPPSSALKSTATPVAAAAAPATATPVAAAAPATATPAAAPATATPAAAAPASTASAAAASAAAASAAAASAAAARPLAPPITAASLEVIGSGSFGLDTNTATLTRTDAATTQMFIKSKLAFAAQKDAFVTFKMTGPMSMGSALLFGITETPQANLSLSNGRQTGLYMTATYNATTKKYFASVHTGTDGDAGFIAFQNPMNPTLTGLPSGWSTKLRNINDDTSTFTIHFDGTNFNFYHNAKLVHSQPPAARPVATAQYFLYMIAQTGQFNLTNFLFGNAASATDVQNYVSRLPQTGGRRRRRFHTRGRRRAGNKRNTRRHRR